MVVQKGLFSHLGRTAMIAGVTAIALTAVGTASAVAGPAAKDKAQTAATSGATDFSAQRRYYRRGGGGALAAAAVIGTGIAIAAAASRPYYGGYGYGYGYGPPVAYYGGPGYYAGPGYGYGYGGYYPNGGRYVGGYNTGQYW